MIKKVYSNPDIFIIEVPLPDNPLKYLNSYVIKTENKNLVIDTGFNKPECHEAFINGLKELEIEMDDKTDLFLTHLHADHTGLVSKVKSEDTTVYISQVDHKFIQMMITDKYWRDTESGFLKEGFKSDELKKVTFTNPSKVLNTNKDFKPVYVKDNSKIKVGEYEFTCIETPGHTPGHMCLYMEKEKILFTGDHILFDISPNIVRWRITKNSLADFLDSLEKIKKLDIKHAFPSHRKNGMNVYERIDQLIIHHKLRLQEIENIVLKKPGLNAYDIASNMKWSIKGGKWDEIPVTQKWFAVGETLSHLDYLEVDNKIYKEFIDGIYHYYSK